MERKVTRVRVPIPARARYALLVSFGVALFATPWALHFSALTLVAVMALLLALVGSTLIPGHAIVGDDGVLVRWLFLRKWVPFSNVEHVTLRTVTTRLKTGESYASGYRVELETSEGSDAFIDVSGGNVRELFDAIHRARRRRHAREKGSFDARALEAAEGAASTWLMRLREMAGRVQGYRVDVPSADELFDVVEDPTASEASRAGAAVVLADARDESVGERLRVARDASASPSLQKAIDAAIEGEDDAIARALDDVRSHR